MATASSLIPQIHSIVNSLASIPFYIYSSALGLRIALRNLNVLLIYLRNLSDDEIPGAIQSRFSEIEDVIGKIPTDGDRKNPHSQLFNSQLHVNYLAEVVSNEWRSCRTDPMSSRLTLDDVIEIADSILHNTADFYDLGLDDDVADPAAVRGLMDEFEVQARFSRDSLLFAKRTGVDNRLIQNLLVHVSPFVLEAAPGFHLDGCVIFDPRRDEYIQHKSCTRLNSQVFQEYARILRSISTLDQADDDVLKDYLSSLISLLWHLLLYQRHPSLFDSLKEMYECLRVFRLNLKQEWRNDIGSFGVLIRDAGILICSLYHVDPVSLTELLQRGFHVVLPQPLESNSNGLDFGDFAMEDILDGMAQVETPMANVHSSGTPRDIGFQEGEVALIVDRLVRGSKQLRLVPISGMAGLGKTTFALKVYNLRSVVYHFQARAWCTITHVFDKKSVLHQLLQQIQPGDYSHMTEDDLADKLRRSLKQKRYLIFFDDVWNPEVLESLIPSFPDDGTESRIILTSRLHYVIPHAMPDEQPHFLRMRTENECLEIIEMNLLNRVGLRDELERFAKLCKGLPLTAVLVAGLLATTAQEGWEAIWDHMSSGGISRMERCEVALEFSYKNLSENLQLCFMYLGAFPEDEEIYVEKLIRLWMAEGFVTKNIDQGIKDVAKEYLDNLVQRNLVMVAKKTSMGGVKTCRIHDLLHDFCLIKGKQENLFHRLLQRHDDLSNFNEPCNLERLSIYSTGHHFKDSRLFCPLAHSLLFFNRKENPKYCCLPDMLFIIHIYKLLKVLDMDSIWFCAAIPNEISLLTHLTYLSISCTTSDIPSSISNLSNLETLIIKLFVIDTITLPCTIWDLQKLKYLHITKMHECYGFNFPLENIENSPCMLELETICGIEFLSDRSMEMQMRKFSNIRKLKCLVLCGVESSQELSNIIVVPEYVRKLESLNLSAERALQYQFDFGSSGDSLKKVTLKKFVLSREEIAVIGKLPNLEVLKLVGIVFSGDEMEIEEGEFSKLIVLALLDSSDLMTLTCNGDEQLPCLKKLVFRSCAKLKEIPHDCLETSSTLEEIELSNCSSALESLVRDIANVHEDFGNSIKVNIHPNPELK